MENEKPVAKWENGQVIQLNKQAWEEITLDDEYIHESGTYLTFEGKYYIYRGV